MAEIEKQKKTSKSGIASAAMLGALSAGLISYSEVKGSTQDPGLAIYVVEIIRTGDEAQGIVKPSSGSREIGLETGDPIRVDGKEVEGALRLEGLNLNNEGSDISSEVDELSGIEVAVGALDQGSSYVRAGDEFSNDGSDNVVFRSGTIQLDRRTRGDPDYKTLLM